MSGLAFPTGIPSISQDTSRTGTLSIPSQRDLTHPEFYNYKNLKRRGFSVNIYKLISFRIIYERIRSSWPLKCLALIIILWTKEDNGYLSFRNTFSTFLHLKDFLENKTEKRDEALKKKRWVGKEIFI